MLDKRYACSSVSVAEFLGLITELPSAAWCSFDPQIESLGVLKWRPLPCFYSQTCHKIENIKWNPFKTHRAIIGSRLTLWHSFRCPFTGVDSGSRCRDPFYPIWDWLFDGCWRYWVPEVTGPFPAQRTRFPEVRGLRLPCVVICVRVSYDALCLDWVEGSTVIVVTSCFVLSKGIRVSTMTRSVSIS